MIIMKSYTKLSGIYDFWQENNSASEWVDFASKLIKSYCSITQGDGENGNLLIADLGCGTGDVAIEFANRGFEVIAIDESEDMLAEAAAKDCREKIAYVCQDITSMELFGTVDVMVCFLDTVNHITDSRKLSSFFKMCKRYLNVGGILIFDVLSLHYMKDVMGNNIFSDLGSNYAAIWSNSYSRAREISTSTISVFSEKGDGLYERTDSVVRERFHSSENLVRLGEFAGLEVTGICADFSLKAPGDESQRIFFCMRNSIDNQKESLKEIGQ